MHPAVKKLAEEHGVQIEERCASDSWTFDGKSIATYFKYSTGEIVRYTDHDLLHEIAHYVLAAPEQRDLPEYGLVWGIASGTSYGPLGGFWRDKHGNLKDTVLQIREGVVDWEEQEIQEKCVHFLCIIWGQKYGISSSICEDLDYSSNWNVYLSRKTNEDCQAGWLALFRLKELGYI